MLNQPSLYIHSSKKICYSIRILKIFLFILIFLLLDSWLGYELKKIDGAKDTYAKYKWHEFYNMPEESIDLVFLGSSHAYRSFDPFVFDKEIGLKSFNMGSPLQKPVESYYVLKETLEYQKPSVVIFEVYWAIFNDEKYFSTKIWNFDSMKPSPAKFGYLLNVFDTDQYLSALFKSIRYHENTGEYIKILTGKGSKKFTEINYNIKPKNYKGKGFVIENKVAEKEDIVKEFKGRVKETTAEFRWDKKQIRYLDKIIKLCKEKNIELILVTAPVAPSYFDAMQKYKYNYEDIHNKVKEIALENKLEYIDYNLKNSEAALFSDKDFSDNNHLNYEGAQKISLHLAKKLKIDYLEMYNRKK
ncbi:hypothetical protein Q428_06420 [Fervidicella metallireducens AeB]|uniref:Uncharacterized protein n=1 Tax=Fervidicella metallireducens AeB TaxID=1403537 RepID=A0A017RWD9_9CLOT|nr:DUF1574 family protein [Fervidicella metallireducens]EYE88719.1 hypothetical protein Q428_06420 [Fervidicella metallireducens AeB]